MSIQLAIAGASGRLGSLVLGLVAQAEGLVCSAALVSRESPSLGRDAGELAGLPALDLPLTSEVAAPMDVLLDFSLPAALPKWIEACRAQSAALVVAATGHSQAQLDELRALSEHVPVLVAPNMALGPNFLMRMVREAGELLGSDFRVAIHEVHRKKKQDAPSGTARALAAILRGGALGDPVITSERRGDEAGEHSVRFSSEGETLTLSHRAESPIVFAQGALRAVRWIARQGPGLYDMQDVLASGS